ncbi:MAG: DotU family type IV/VI secretion system protein [Phycisphaerales bacterium]
MQQSPEQTDTARPTLARCADELFQYVMRVNRSAKLEAEAQPAADQVRAEVVAILDRVQRCCSGDPVAGRAYEQAFLSLVFFADSMLLTSEWAGVPQWKPIQYDHNEHGGDDKFWELFDDAMARSDEAADQCVEAYYIMVGLGFTGSYEGMHDMLRQKMNQAWMRVQKTRGVGGERKLCPDAYRHVRTETLSLNPAGSLLKTAIIVLVGIVTLLGATRAVVNGSRAEVRTITETMSETPAPEGEAR